MDLLELEGLTREDAFTVTNVTVTVTCAGALALMDSHHYIDWTPAQSFETFLLIVRD